MEICLDITTETKSVWNIKLTVIPIIIGVLENASDPSDTNGLNIQFSI